MICLATALLFDYALDDGAGGLSSPDSLQQWAYGNATSGPMTGPVWGTRLGGDYFNDSVAVLDVPLPDLSTADRPVLVVEQWFDLGVGDHGVFELDTGAGFVQVEPIGGYPGPSGFEGTSGGWSTAGLDLTGVPPGAALRLRLVADEAGRGAGWYIRAMRVEDGDPIPPGVSIAASPDDTQDLAGPYPVDVRIEEDLHIESAEIVWSAGGAGGREPLELDTGSIFTGAIPAQPPDTVVSWSVEVADCSSTTTVPGDPFRVFLAAPENLQGPAQPHVVARSVTLTWSPPDSPYTPLSYEVETLATGELAGPVTTTSTDVPLGVGVPQDFVVRARYPQGIGDESAVLSLDVEVPELLEVRPAVLSPGDQVYVELQGRSLYLLDGLSTLSLGGDGVTVTAFEVRDVNRGVALVEVAVDTPPGPRSLVVTGAQGAFGFEEAVEVLDASSAPRILSITPDSVVQGEEVELTIVASEPFAGEVALTTDDELIVGGTPEVDGDTLTVRVAAIGRARSGPHDLILDDGERLWTAELEVDEFIASSPRRCSTTGAPVGWLGLLWISVWRRRPARCCPG